MRNFAIINLNTLYKNAYEIKSKLSKKTKLCAVVKADGYGHGGEKIAQKLFPIADCFAVAIVEEGVLLRLSGITKDILVLNPLFSCDIERAIYYRLTITVSNIEQLKKIESECEKQQRSVKVHIKFNTGMNRNGVDSLLELKEILGFITRFNYIILDGFYSHLAFAENKKHLTTAVNQFLLANKVVKGYNSNIVSHISASGGFLCNQDFDMVRIGILLYGYKPFYGDRVNVKPIMKIYSPVLSKRKIKAGESAMYGFCQAQQDTTISLVRFGYADGLPRQNISDIFNNRCMDISAYIGNNKGKFFCVLSNADELAKKYNTISYEILTKSTFRTEKIYIE